MSYRFVGRESSLRLENSTNFAAFNLPLMDLGPWESNKRGLCRYDRFARFNRDLRVSSSYSVDTLQAVASLFPSKLDIKRDFTERVEWISKELQGEWSLRFRSHREPWASGGQVELGTIRFVFAEHKDFVAFKLRWGI